MKLATNFRRRLHPLAIMLLCIHSMAWHVNSQKSNSADKKWVCDDWIPFLLFLCLKENYLLWWLFLSSTQMRCCRIKHLISAIESRGQEIWRLNLASEHTPGKENVFVIDIYSTLNYSYFSSFSSHKKVLFLYKVEISILSLYIAKELKLSSCFKTD